MRQAAVAMAMADDARSGSLRRRAVREWRGRDARAWARGQGARDEGWTSKQVVRGAGGTALSSSTAGRVAELTVAREPAQPYAQASTSAVAPAP
jgi:hypothetical protein